MSVSEQHTSSIFRVDCHEDKGSMFCEDEDSSHLRCDAVSFGQQFMMIWRVIECSKHGTTCSTTQHHIPKDASLRLHVSEDLTSHIPVNCQTFSYHSMICLTMEMWSLLQGIYIWWDVNWKHILTKTITVRIQSLIIYYGWNILVSWWSYQGIVSALTNRNSISE